MKKFINSILFISTTFTGLAGAQATDFAPPVTESVRSNNKMGLELIRQVIKTDLAQTRSQQNTLISPISAYAAFSMLHAGLRGETLRNLNGFLGISPLPNREFDRQSATLLNSLKIAREPEGRQPQGMPKEPVLGINNSAWSDRRFKFSRDFMSSLQTSYLAETRALDFTDPSSAEAINKWADEKTNGLVKKVISPDELSAALWVLMNATYLEANWATKFDDLAAEQSPRFSKLDGSQVPVKMITGHGQLNYLEGRDYQAVEIPFYGKEQLSFHVILPRTTRDFEKWTTDGAIFDLDHWNNLAAAFAKYSTSPEARDTDVTVTLPTFTFSASATLLKNAPLTRNLGLGFLFKEENAADFSPLGEPPTNVQMIRQNTKIALDKHGVKAAAVTVISGGRTGGPMPTIKKTFVADKPFVFVITSKKTGTILFVGTVVDPAKES